jgi:hypothetical protein
MRGNPTRETLGSILDVIGLKQRVVPKGSVATIPNSGTPQRIRRSYTTHRRAKKKAHAINQLAFPFLQQVMPVMETGNVLAEAIQINSVSTGHFGIEKMQSVAPGFHIKFPYLNQEQNETMPVPLDLLVAASTGAAASIL